MDLSSASLAFAGKESDKRSHGSVLPERAKGYEFKSPNVEFHRGVNFPNGILGQPPSSVRSIFGRMAHVPKRFANNGDDRGTSDFQPFSRSSLKRKPRGRPTKDCLANVTPLRF